MDKDTEDMIHAILKRGNDVQIQRSRDGYVVLEVNKIIRGKKENTILEDVDSQIDTT